jgi:hypothetical protein
MRSILILVLCQASDWYIFRVIKWFHRQKSRWLLQSMNFRSWGRLSPTFGLMEGNWRAPYGNRNAAKVNRGHPFRLPIWLLGGSSKQASWFGDKNQHNMFKNSPTLITNHPWPLIFSIIGSNFVVSTEHDVCCAWSGEPSSWPSTTCSHEASKSLV